MRGLGIEAPEDNKKEKLGKATHKCHEHELHEKTHEERFKFNEGYETGYACDICKQTQTCDLSYSCFACGFDLCPNCAPAQSLQTHSTHQHELPKTTHEQRVAFNEGFANGYWCSECV